eukprot:NODE_1034_length_691_cov_862.845794_g804_i0.p1 GENE.NODE_1034_length_691_cov_862.845794_g804_i0~~NODE_1034_length_691_cov_862.845794_g804_i0.p1  ORF type:complete len:215 (+),score=70.30 NODE_1034_length_691_cov_862.845794_g804_i0:30-647(+)
MGEYAVLLSAHLGDFDAFERNMTQVKTYYDDYAADVAPSERRMIFLGMSLLRLLAQNKICEFHTELERIPFTEHCNAYIDFVVGLERHLMEGSYHKLLQARKLTPSHDYDMFMDMLQHTVRSEIADCVSKAYRELTLADATKLLMFQDQSETRAFVQAQQWPVKGDIVTFEAYAEKEEAKAAKIPCFEVGFTQQLEYAHEMERIV